MTVIAHELVHVTCWHCGILYGIPVHYRASRVKDGKSIKCPNGHPNVFHADPPTEAEKELRKELARFKLKAVHEREQAEARRSAASV